MDENVWNVVRRRARVKSVLVGWSLHWREMDDCSKQFPDLPRHRRTSRRRDLPGPIPPARLPRSWSADTVCDPDLTFFNYTQSSHASIFMNASSVGFITDRMWQAPPSSLMTAQGHKSGSCRLAGNDSHKTLRGTEGTRASTRAENSATGGDAERGRLYISSSENDRTSIQPLAYHFNFFPLTQHSIFNQHVSILDQRSRS